MACNWCSPKSLLLLLLLLSAVPLSLLVSLERRASASPAYTYHSSGWLRECAKWDDLHRRFLVSFMEGGVGQISLPDSVLGGGDPLDEVTVFKDADLAGNGSLGMAIDRPRNRLLVVAADVIGNRYSGVAAYDLGSWKRLFLTHLSSAGDGKTFADDVAVDNNGNTYVTDAKGSKIWKVSPEGKLVSMITSPLFVAQEWYGNFVGLNGIVCHPDGYLLVIHTMTGNLYKVDRLEEEGGEVVKLVEGVKLRFGDGLELLSATRLVVAASHPSGRLVESTDGWETAAVVGRFVGPTHRLATSATVKDGRVFLSHMFGLGYPKKKHMLVEAVFSAP